MKTRRKRSRRLLAAAAALLIAVICCVSSTAGAQEPPGFTWVTETDGITVTGIRGESVTKLIVPEQIEGLPVVRIGGYALYDNRDITEVVLPDSLKEIGGEAFRGCAKLKTVHLGSGLTSIGEEAFAFCDALQEITLPAGLVSIGEYAFWHCSALADVEVPPGVRDLPDGAFGQCRSLSHIVLPQSLETIGDLAFATAALEVFELPQQVRSIGEGAFTGCETLRSLALPQGLHVLPAYMASDCPMLETVNLPDTIRRIGTGAFSHCSALAHADIPEHCDQIDELAFWKCSALSSVQLPYGTRVIAYGTFWDCGALSRVSLPASLETIEPMAFYRTDLRDVFYDGTPEQWEAVNVEQQGFTQTGVQILQSNAVLAQAQIHFASSGTGLPEGVRIRAYSPLWLDPLPQGSVLLRGLEAGRPVTGTTVSNLLGQFVIPPAVTARVVHPEPKAAMPDTDVVGTGDVLEMRQAHAEDVFRAAVVVAGDVLGTGVMSLSQLVRTAEAVRGTRPLEGVWRTAADFNNTGRVDLADLVREAQLFAQSTRKV